MGLFDGIDYSKLNESLDFVAWDNYPMFESDYTSFYGPALGHDLTRGSKYNQNFMVMEEQGGLPGWQIFWGRQAPAALYRLWAYQAVAHGADAVCFFRWRTSRYGTEQYWQGVLDQDSYPNARYQIVKQMGGELPKLTELLQGSKVASHVALLVSPDSRWAFHIQPLVEGAGAPGGSKVNFDYNRELRQYYDAVRRLGLNVDVVFPQTDFSAYKAIIAPSLFVTDPALVARLKQFVEQGGTLALTYRSGVKDEHNVVTDKTLPGPLAELAGVAIHEFDPAAFVRWNSVSTPSLRLPRCLPLTPRAITPARGQSRAIESVEAPCTTSAPNLLRMPSTTMRPRLWRKRLELLSDRSSLWVSRW